MVPAMMDTVLVLLDSLDSIVKESWRYVMVSFATTMGLVMTTTAAVLIHTLDMIVLTTNVTLSATTEELVWESLANVHLITQEPRVKLTPTVLVVAPMAESVLMELVSVFTRTLDTAAWMSYVTQAVKTMDPAMVVCVSVIMDSQGDVVKSPQVRSVMVFGTNCDRSEK
jgi:hypothetical protein